ncbi:MAG: hypothetical protein ATN35_00445 [Epulopiscium sp. Nele67-Bin004]|nr:MAG: hypothetical protein ATN35_00445 [Epulopiscium sp. Nele67-Bin004]
MKYQLYRWEFVVKTSVLTPFHSDTLWGHIVWAIKYLHGDKVFEEYLTKFVQDEYKPFIISNAFPKGYLPFINLPHSFDKPATKAEAILLSNFKSLIQQVKFVPKDMFVKMKNGLSIVDIYNEYKKDPEYLTKLGMLDFEQYETATKNSIDRLTGGTDDGALYSQVETVYTTPLEVYIKVQDDEYIQEAINYIGQTGYGKKASTGKGQLQTISFEKVDTLLDNTHHTQAYISLSSYIPKVGDYENCLHANISSKKGKIANSNEVNPFKSPYCYYEAGSIFEGSVIDNKGQMLQGLHTNSEVVQYGVPFIVGVKL